MSTDVPAVHALTRRLAETPADFLAPARVRSRGAVDVVAVISDLLWQVQGRPPTPGELSALVVQAAAKTNLQQLRLVTAWLLHAPELRRPEHGPPMLAFLTTGLGELAELIDAALFVSDDERREELARLALAAFGIVPAGERPEQARDRLTAIDSVERKRLLAAYQKAVEREREVERVRAERAAQEAAAKGSRE